MVEFLLILGAIIIYFAPLLVAAWVRHPRLAYIGGLNAALGVTGVGWIGALVWALRRRKVAATSHHGDGQMPRPLNTGLFAMVGLMLGVAMVATVGVSRLHGRKINQDAAAAYTPVTAMAAVSSSPVVGKGAAAGGDRAGKGDHGHRRRHKRQVHHEVGHHGIATYVDGVPGRGGHHRHHRHGA